MNTLSWPCKKVAAEVEVRLRAAVQRHAEKEVPTSKMAWVTLTPRSETSDEVATEIAEARKAKSKEKRREKRRQIAVDRRSKKGDR